MRPLFVQPSSTRTRPSALLTAARTDFASRRSSAGAGEGWKTIGASRCIGPMRGFGSGSTGAAIGSDGGGSLGALVIGVASGADVGVRTGVHATSTMHDAITRAERTQAFLHRTVARAMGRRWAAPRPAILRAPSRRAMLGPERAAFAHGGFVARGRPLALVFRYQLHRPLLTMS